MAAVSMAAVKELRERLGAGMVDSKNALTEADGDIEKAIEILRLKGLKGVAKREGREASEGLVAVKQGDDTTVMIELVCETDFVAKNEKFGALGERVLDAITAAGAAGNFELNVMMPVIARNLLESIRLLANVSRLLADRCVSGFTADEERMRTYAESSPSVVTPLNRHVGYEKAAAIAKKAMADGTTIRETVIAMGLVEDGTLTEEQLDTALDVDSMTHP